MELRGSEGAWTSPKQSFDYDRYWPKAVFAVMQIFLFTHDISWNPAQVCAGHQCQPIGWLFYARS